MFTDIAKSVGCTSLHKRLENYPWRRWRRFLTKDGNSAEEIMLKTEQVELSGTCDASMRSREEGDPSAWESHDDLHRRHIHTFYTSLLGGIHTVVWTALLTAGAEVGCSCLLLPTLMNQTYRL